MKTTLEIPDPLYREAKIRAFETGQTLKELMIRALTRELRGGAVEESAPSGWKQRKLLPGFAALWEAGTGSGGTDSADLLAADREDRDGSLP